jgi:hypothetical protein
MFADKLGHRLFCWGCMARMHAWVLLGVCMSVQMSAHVCVHVYVWSLSVCHCVYTRMCVCLRVMGWRAHACPHVRHRPYFLHGARCCGPGTMAKADVEARQSCLRSGGLPPRAAPPQASPGTNQLLCSLSALHRRCETRICQKLRIVSFEQPLRINACQCSMSTSCCNAKSKSELEKCLSQMDCYMLESWHTFLTLFCIMAGVLWTCFISQGGRGAY